MTPGGAHGFAPLTEDLTKSFNNIGNVFSKQGNMAAALETYRHGLVIADQMAGANPENSNWQRNLSVSYSNLGDVLLAQRNLREAFKSYRDGLAIAERLVGVDPGNSQWQSDLSASHNRLGDVLVELGNLPEALNAYRRGLAIAQSLAQAGACDVDFQRVIAVLFNNIGAILVNQRKLTEGLNAYRNGKAIFDQLVRTDESNLSWKRDLSVSLDRIGEALVEQGNFAEALKVYRDALAIREKLATRDPSNATWQRDLSVSWDRIGDVLVAQTDLAEAFTAYCDGLTIRQQLVQMDRKNIVWQRDLAVSHTRLATIHSLRGDHRAAAMALMDAQALLNSIHDRGIHLDPEAANLRADLSRQIAGQLAVQPAGTPQAATLNFSLAQQSHQKEPTDSGVDKFAQARSLLATSGAAVAAAALPDAARPPAAPNLGPSARTKDARTSQNVGRNEPCPCGSGRRYKHCHGRLGNRETGNAHELPPRQRGATPHVSTEALAAPPLEAITLARTMLEAGKVADAADLLAQAPASRNLPNARAVCALRLGQSQRAVDLLRPMVLPDGTRVPPETTPDEWIINYATALALAGDPSGASRALEWVKDASHPGTTRVRDALDAWRKSLSWTEAARFRLGGPPPRPVRLDYPPGEL